VQASSTPIETPSPPHVDFEQTKNLAAALVKGDPERVDVIAKSLREKLLEHLPRR
jgi:pyruvate dehydrogenase (quinone)